MNTRYLSGLFTFILFILCHPILAQSLSDLEAQRLLIENIPKQKITQENNKI